MGLFGPRMLEHFPAMYSKFRSPLLNPYAFENLKYVKQGISIILFMHYHLWTFDPNARSALNHPHFP